MNTGIEEVRAAFIATFASKPMVVRAPGRINIIGEHTDYNQGWALPAAIDLAAHIFIQKRKDKKCQLIAIDIGEDYRFNIDGKLKPVKKNWVNYFLGVISQLMGEGHQLNGFDLMFTSNIPIGAGLSSSAAIECGFTFALSEVFNLNIPSKEIARIGQKAEHEFVGVQCGIMDQYVSCMGKKGHAIKLDCRSLTHEHIPVDMKDHEFILFDSCVKHNLIETEYNTRRQQCEAGLTAVRKFFPEVKSLRDVTLEHLTQARSAMSIIEYQRCRFVMEENSRVVQSCEALKQGDVHLLGELMTKTHEGLRDEYEVSCKELDTLIDLACRLEGFVGGRMMGGGFGGCTINLIKKSCTKDIIRKVKETYYQATGIPPKVYPVQIADGVDLIKQNSDEIRS